MVFVFYVLAAPVHAVVLGIGIDPVGDLQQLLSGELDFLVSLRELCCPGGRLSSASFTLSGASMASQDAVVRAERTGGHIVDIPPLG
jgi:hypothetical protein